eukprot:5366464-Karenia_brevis.AAC.1
MEVATHGSRAAAQGTEDREGSVAADGLDFGGGAELRAHNIGTRDDEDDDDAGDSGKRRWQWQRH